MATPLKAHPHLLEHHGEPVANGDLAARPRMVTARGLGAGVTGLAGDDGQQDGQAVTWAMVCSNRPTTAAARRP